jgi:enamine deaminase RidA (YjgF/YER057c/UK114 family)
MTDIERKHTNARMSKIVRHDALVYLCGQTAAGTPSAESDIAAQTHETLARVDALLDEAGSNRSRILSAVVHLRDMADFAAMNAAWESWIPPGSAPARTTVEARLASPGLLVEVTVIAVVADR